MLDNAKLLEKSQHYGMAVHSPNVEKLRFIEGTPFVEYALYGKEKEFPLEVSLPIGWRAIEIEWLIDQMQKFMAVAPSSDYIYI